MTSALSKFAVLSALIAVAQASPLDGHSAIMRRQNLPGVDIPPQCQDDYNVIANWVGSHDCASVNCLCTEDYNHAFADMASCIAWSNGPLNPTVVNQIQGSVTGIENACAEEGITLQSLTISSNGGSGATGTLSSATLSSVPITSATVSATDTDTLSSTETSSPEATSSAAPATTSPSSTLHSIVPGSTGGSGSGTGSPAASQTGGGGSSSGALQLSAPFSMLAIAGIVGGFFIALTL